MVNVADLKSAFLTAAYGKLSPNLLKYSADLHGDSISARIVVLDAINKDELDTVFEILGDTVGYTGGSASFDLVRVPSPIDAASDAELPIKLFRSTLLDQTD
jgi:hypothetical protein